MVFSSAATPGAREFAPPSAREWTLLILLLMVGFSLRAYHISQVALSHFDESVYAYSAMGITYPEGPRFLFPGQKKFSPPLYFSLIGIFYRLAGGPSDTAAILPNVLLGTLTIALVWWAGRRWFGPPSGIAAAAMVALNEFHIRNSRTALTDVAFALFFLLALMVIHAAFERKKILAAILAGLAVGLAWNTKYHGWLALAIAGLAFLLCAWQNSVGIFSDMRRIWLFLVAAATAAVCYLPWALVVQFYGYGGYAELARYQSYFLSLNWIPNAWTQILNQLYFEGPLSRASVFVALLCVLLLAGGRARLNARSLWVMLICATSLFIGASGAAALLAFLALPALLRKPAPFANWLVASWLFTWIVLTPFYTPYARLTIPLLLVAFLLAGRTLQDAFAESEQPAAGGILAPALASLGAMAVALLPSPTTGPDRTPWQTTRSIPEIASRMDALLPKESRVNVVSEPALLYYLHLAGRGRSLRYGLPIPVGFDKQKPFYVVVRQGLKDPIAFEQIAEMGQAKQLALVATYSPDPSELELLDRLGPIRAHAFLSQPDHTFDFLLYRCVPAPPQP